MNQVITKRGVYLKQEMSPYKLILFGLTFVFSSKAKMNSFIRKAGLNLKKSHSITNELNRFDFEIDVDELDLKVLLSTYNEVMPKWEVIINEKELHHI